MFTPKNIAEGLRRVRDDDGERERERQRQERERERQERERQRQERERQRQQRSKTSVTVDLGGMITWAWGRYSDHQKTVAKEESKVLELAAEHFGWLTEAQVVEALGFSVRAARATMERLVKAELCERFTGKGGFPVFVFPQFLPPFRACEYCDTEYICSPVPKCPGCGAPEPKAGK